MQRSRRFTQFIHKKITSRRTIDRWVVWIVALGALLLVGVIVVYSLTNRSIIDQSIVSEAQFPVYTPSQAPDGFELRPEQTSLSGNILTYGFMQSTTGEQITVTVQTRPNAFDVSQMTKGGALSSTTAESGTLYDLSVVGSSQYLLDTGDALVYITSSQQISTTTINELADSLAKRN